MCGGAAVEECGVTCCRPEGNHLQENSVTLSCRSCNSDTNKKSVCSNVIKYSDRDNTSKSCKKNRCCEKHSKTNNCISHNNKRNEKHNKNEKKSDNCDCNNNVGINISKNCGYKISTNYQFDNDNENSTDRNCDNCVSEKSTTCKKLLKKRKRASSQKQNANIQGTVNKNSKSFPKFNNKNTYVFKNNLVCSTTEHSVTNHEHICNFCGSIENSYCIDERNHQRNLNYSCSIGNSCCIDETNHYRNLNYFNSIGNSCCTDERNHHRNLDHSRSIETVKNNHRAAHFSEFAPLMRETLSQDEDDYLVSSELLLELEARCNSTNMASAGSTNITDFPLLFENEHGSDVTLLVGSDGSRERIPAHSWVLAHSNDYFKTLLTGPLRDRKICEFYFNDDQPKGFRSFIRWLYACGCSPKCTQSALDTLQVAIKYLSVELVQHMVGYLSKNLHPDNVLQIMAWGHQYTSNATLAPSAPPADGGQDEDLPPPYPGTAPPPSYDSINGCDPTSSCLHLVNGCFSLLDVKANDVLASEALEEVSTPLLSSVLSRDTLGVTSEVFVVEALYRWSSAECRRRHMHLTQESRRKVLGRMLTLPRLFTISHNQLASLTKLYETVEIEYVTARITRSSTIPSVPPIFNGFVDQMTKKRLVPEDINRNGKKDKKDKQKGSGKKRFSSKELMWDIFSLFAHMID